MTRNPTLIIGLGRTGGLVARELQALLPSSSDARSPWFLIFGSPPPEEGDLSPTRFDGPRNLEEIPLSMELLRETMSGVREWGQYLPWLARYDDSSYLDEIRPLGAAGYRSFARLATVRSDGLIDLALRRALAYVREASPAEYVDVLLIAGAGGGLGSALLTDLTFLVQRHVRKSTRTACLVLPPPGEAGRSRFDANSFATLCEVSALKAMRFPYEIRFESLPPIDIRVLGDEAWQRVYLFEAADGEDIPYPGAARQVAEALALQLQPRIGRLRRQISQDFTSVRVAPGPLPIRLEKAFSACNGLTFEFPKDVPGVYREDPIKEPMLDRAWEAFAAAFDRGLLELRDNPVYETRKRDLAKVHDTLWQIEETLLGAIKPIEIVQNMALKETRRGKLRFTEGSPDIDKDQLRTPLEILEEPLRKVLGLEEAFRSIHNDLNDPPPVLPIPQPPAAGNSTTQRTGRDLVEDLNALRAASGAIWPKHAEASEARSERRIRSFPIFSSLRRNMVWNLTERVAVLQALVRTPDFKQAFCKALRILAHQWLGYRPDVVAPDPSFETWLSALDEKIHNAESNIFSAGTQQTERRVFALALLPETLPPGFDRDVLRNRIERAVEGVLQCRPRIIDDPGERVQIYFEDLFHDACDVRRLPLYRKAYVAEPVKELFHTDHRFVTGHLCDGLCEADDRSPVFCGNPGCNADLRLLPVSTRICPSCGNPIRSRCGNPGCRIRDLHTRPEATARTCPGCGGLNHAAWWTCCQHGKIATLVPIDKERCPECVQRHHDDPVLYPADRISVRPDLRKRRACWRCEELAKSDPAHPVFWIPPDLYPFVHDGVNGHDRVRFFEMAKKYKLDGDCKCPSCGTSLIPVDHRSASKTLPTELI
jgi:hypothetical protein